LDARKRAAEWQLLCDKFRELGDDRRANHLEKSIKRILANTSENPWPPVWRRLTIIDAAFSAMSTWLFRVDAEGYFSSNTPSGDTPERTEILRIGEELHTADEHAKRNRNRRRDG
jgi:hypothetical protein